MAEVTWIAAAELPLFRIRHSPLGIRTSGVTSDVAQDPAYHPVEDPGHYLPEDDAKDLARDPARGLAKDPEKEPGKHPEGNPGGAGGV
jgi:hypothetical protein